MSDSQTSTRVATLAGVRKLRTDDGVWFAYHTAGTGVPTVLAVRGWGRRRLGSLLARSEQAPRFCESYCKFAAIDLRGHGESGQLDTGFTLEVFTRDILAVADHMGASPLEITSGAPPYSRVQLSHPCRVI